MNDDNLKTSRLRRQPDASKHTKKARQTQIFEFSSNEPIDDERFFPDRVSLTFDLLLFYRSLIRLIGLKTPKQTYWNTFFLSPTIFFSKRLFLFDNKKKKHLHSNKEREIFSNRVNYSEKWHKQNFPSMFVIFHRGCRFLPPAARSIPAPIIHH
jgi:hypothetical protein